MISLKTRKFCDAYTAQMLSLRIDVSLPFAFAVPRGRLIRPRLLLLLLSFLFGVVLRISMVVIHERRVAVTVVVVLDRGPGPEHQVPDGHENGSVQGHVVDHQRGHDHHFEIGQNDWRESQTDQLRYQHVRVHHHFFEVSSGFGYDRDRRRRDLVGGVRSGYGRRIHVGFGVTDGYQYERQR